MFAQQFQGTDARRVFRSLAGQLRFFSQTADDPIGGKFSTLGALLLTCFNRFRNLRIP